MRSVLADCSFDPSGRRRGSEALARDRPLSVQCQVAGQLEHHSSFRRRSPAPRFHRAKNQDVCVRRQLVELNRVPLSVVGFLDVQVFVFEDLVPDRLVVLESQSLRTK